MPQGKIKIRLKGHETFILREGWITKGLTEIHKNPLVFTRNGGADALGVGTNMAKAIRYWLRESGLTAEIPRQGTFLTAAGSIIFQNDPYMEDDFALWIVHSNLARKLHTVTSWYLFFNTLDVDEFTREELGILMRRQLEQLTGEEKISERSVNDDCNALLHMYTREHIENYDPEDKKHSPFARLGLVKREDRRYRKAQPDLNIVHEHVVLYLLQDYFRTSGRNSISIADLLEKEGLPGRLLNLKRAALNDYLDRLADKERLTVNRTAGLDMVYRNCLWTGDEVIQDYYKQLKG